MSARTKRRSFSAMQDMVRAASRLKVEIRYNMSDNNKNSAVAIADMWKQIGVETTFVSTDLKTHFAFLREGGDFDIARYGWIGDYSDPQNFLFLVQSDNTGFNAGRYQNGEYDLLMSEASTENDLRRRSDISKASGGDFRPRLTLDPCASLWH